MKTKSIIGTVISFAVILFYTSCYKEGTGGKSGINGYVKHHEKIIPYSTVYIKYGSTDFSGASASNYDASSTTGSDGHYEFKDLRKGDYYLYGSGYDNSILAPVTGGVAVKLKYNKNTTIDIPVTE